MRPMHFGLSALALVLFTSASCSKNESQFNLTANQIGEVGEVPQPLKLAAATMLRKCKVPIKGRHIYRHMEGSADETPYTLELSRVQFEDDTITTCLLAQAKSLGVDREIDLGEEAPPLRSNTPT